MLVESWRDFEESFGDEAEQAVPTKLLPRRVKRKRAIETESGDAAGWEEYYDHVRRLPPPFTARPRFCAET